MQLSLPLTMRLITCYMCFRREGREEHRGVRLITWLGLVVASTEEEAFKEDKTD